MRSLVAFRVAQATHTGLVLLLAAVASGCVSSDGGPSAVTPAELTSAPWRSVQRSPQVVSEGDDAVLRFDERHDAGMLWNPTLAMQDGDIDVDLRGRDVEQKSFVGIACRVAADGAAQMIWLRPFNFRSPDPERRTHSLQYASYPDYPWERLRRERPGAFEAELVPAPDPTAWVHLHVELRGRSVRVFVDQAERPALALETPEPARAGGVGLWVGSDSDGDFKDLRVVRRD